ncbi:MAG: hypothetical protein KH375_05100 [Alistipes sp.]|nr:hypothetical protein [Alistipes sp.]
MINVDKIEPIIDALPYMKNIILILMICGILSGCTKTDIESVKPDNSVEPEKYISFQDRTVEEICINNWDSNGDGKLSEKEAAEVKSIGNVFSYKKIFYFDELKYFTNITEIPEYAFFYLEKPSDNYVEMFLKRITIPENVCKIGLNAISVGRNAIITFKPTTPPSVSGNFIGGYISSLVIYVPSDSYKTAGGYWRDYYNHIVVKY